ncbi:hypothetical protein BHE97_10995 [Aeromicrobium sp. PE09-221]|uniref:hypothetical protein n=1 Tax=Aeromicrobium sp. PE09-221 TaxID=1898043 RepID=UPI000B3E41B2|nr:hypothetical protein [Aeromicrobium sp. PE09-221]OUZ09249.1 hypothetical protein BHE97_10995 [Aeromicrobium sp. PE09-221]
MEPQTGLLRVRYNFDGDAPASEQGDWMEPEDALAWVELQKLDHAERFERWEIWRFDGREWVFDRGVDDTDSAS